MTVAEAPPVSDGLVAEAPPSPAGPAPEDGAGVRLPPSLPLPRVAPDAALQHPPDRVRLPRPPRAGRRVHVPRRNRRRPRRDHLPPRPRPLAVHRQARGRAVADRRLPAAADPRPELGADGGRPPPHAPAQAAAAAFPRRGRPALHGDDRRGRRPRDRQLADRPAVRARPAHAGDHPRRDHGRDLRRSRARRRRGRQSTGCAPRSAGWSTPPRAPSSQLAELLNLGSDEAVGPTRLFVSYLDRHLYAAIGARREAGHAGRTDILSLLLDAETEDGERLTDQELRDELLTLVLAGHETTANSLAWGVRAAAAPPGRVRAASATSPARTRTPTATSRPPSTRRCAPGR